jgi:hypothetical protein
MRASEFLSENDEPVRLKLRPLDNGQAKAWIEKVYAKYPTTMQNNHVMIWGEGDDQQFAMFELTPSFSKRGAVEVKWFQAYPLRQGVGSRAMQELQAMAREDGIALTLFPWDKGQVSQSKLTKFYKGQGFKPIQKGGKSLYWGSDVNEAELDPRDPDDVSYDEKVERIKNQVEKFASLNGVNAILQPWKPSGQTIGIELTDLYADNPGSGGGSKVMMLLCKLADEEQISIYLRPESARNRNEFYPRFNFENDKRHYGFMVRYPPFEDIDEAELDPRGWGETPQGTDIDYFGLKVKMRPSTFLKLSHPLGASDRNADVEKHMQGGGKIAYPFLEIKDPVEWEDGDFSQLGKVSNHEGRNRMTHWIKMKGDEPIQVNVFLRGANRRRFVTNDMIQAMSQGLISQTGQLVKNPFDASTALEETRVQGDRWTGDEPYRQLVELDLVKG